jgi:4'-phosphopantetheinyl transferase
MNSKALHLWCANPDDLLDTSTARACAALLTPEETARWQRYKPDRHRRESLATRALMRISLSHYRPIAPAAWRFSENEYGKPFIHPDCGLRFNLSNSLGLVVCLVAEHDEVGVDVESHTRSTHIIEVVKKVFSPEERSQLDQLEYEAKLDRVLSLWTLKESYIKARGMGLALPLDKISFLFGGPEGIRLRIDPAVDPDPGRWRFCSFDHAGHRVAVLVEQAGGAALNLWQARPPLPNPMPLGACTAEWLPRP